MADKSKDCEHAETPKENLKHQYRSLDLEGLKGLLADPSVSKNQKKKITKQIEWLENAEDRRLKRKEKKKEKALRKRKLFEDPDLEDKLSQFPKPKKPRKSKISTTTNFEEHVHVAVDLSFDDYMTNLDLSKLRKQLAWCYKENRRCSKPVQYHICGLSERMKAGMDQSYVNWDVHYDPAISERFDKDDLVYLSSESSEVITDILPGKVYVIGGLVDHNKHKGLTHELATQKNIATARLPLEEHVDMKSRKVLAVNHVFDIIVAYCELRDWKAALLRAIPMRKGAVPLE